MDFATDFKSLNKLIFLFDWNKSQFFLKLWSSLFIINFESIAFFLDSLFVPCNYKSFIESVIVVLNAVIKFSWIL